MKKLLLFLLCALLSFTAFSQEENFRPVQINFGFPLSTINVKKAKEYTNGFSINLLVGISKNERSLALAGISNIIANDATGLQIASVFNHIGNNGYGIAVTGVSNTVMQSYKGIQIAGVANYSGSGVGMQIAGVTNINNGANIGAQISGVANINNGAAMGLQISGVTNINNGSFIGLQLSSVANIAGDVKGMQLSAVMNKAKKVKGVQFATLLNIAEESNFPIAFINIIKNGKMGVAISYDNMNNTMLSFRSGGKYTYGILGVGYNNLINDGSKIVAEAGYGIHIPITNWIEINNELKATSVGFSNDKVCNNFSYLLTPSFTFLNHYNLFGGVSFNYLNTNYTNSNDLMPRSYFWSKDGNYNQRMYLGYQIGLQYVF